MSGVYHPPTQAELALLQRVVGDTCDDWANSVEGRVPVPDGPLPADASEWTELVFATPEQNADLKRRIDRALAR